MVGARRRGCRGVVLGGTRRTGVELRLRSATSPRFTPPHRRGNASPKRGLPASRQRLAGAASREEAAGQSRPRSGNCSKTRAAAPRRRIWHVREGNSRYAWRPPRPSPPPTVIPSKDGTQYAPGLRPMPGSNRLPLGILGPGLRRDDGRWRGRGGKKVPRAPQGQGSRLGGTMPSSPARHLAMPLRHVPAWMFEISRSMCCTTPSRTRAWR